MLRRVYSHPRAGRFKDIGRCHIGELNSEYGRPFFQETRTRTSALLLRGRHIARYLADERTEGTNLEKRWIDERAYIDSLTNADGRPALRPRVVKQAITDLNDPRRIIATVVPAGRYLLDSCDYIAPDGRYSPEYVLAVLLSDVAEWRFRMTSSNNNVNAYEIDELPFPLVDDWSAREWREVSDEIIGAFKSVEVDNVGELHEIVSGFLEAGAPMVALHRAVTVQVRSIVATRQRIFQRLDDFRFFLRSIPGGDGLPAAFAEGNWISIDTEEEFFAHLRASRVRLSPSEIRRVRTERSRSRSYLLEAIGDSEVADDALNWVITALLGLSREDGMLLREALPSKPPAFGISTLVAPGSIQAVASQVAEEVVPYGSDTV